MVDPDLPGERKSQELIGLEGWGREEKWSPVGWNDGKHGRMDAMGPKRAVKTEATTRDKYFG